MSYPAEALVARSELVYQLLRVYAFAAVDRLFDAPKQAEEETALDSERDTPAQ